MESRGVVVTRDEGEDGPLGRLLQERGFDVHRWPTIRTAPPSDPTPLRDALAGLADFDWMVFTSRRAVAAVIERLGPMPGAARSGEGVDGGERADGPEGGRERVRVAAVGESTAGALREAGWPVDIVPEVQTGEALLAALVGAGVGSGTRVLFPASDIARDTLPDGLIEAGAVVVRVEAYRTEAARPDPTECQRALESGAVELITFTSPSTVDNLAEALGPDVLALARERLRAVAIGPTTGAAAERAGFDVVEAEPHSLEGLADRVVEAAHLRTEEA